MAIGRFPWKAATTLAVAMAVLVPGPLVARPRSRPLPPLVRGPGDALTRSLRTGTLTPSEYALERARTLFGLKEVRHRFGQVARPHPRSATLLLRDLALRLNQLNKDDRAAAHGLLARPTDPLSGGQFDVVYSSPAVDTCSEHMCFHWVEDVGDADAPPPADVDADGMRDWVETTVEVFEEQVWAHEIDTLGFRPPKSDESSASNGGDGRLDIYLANLGDDGIYGYCTSDDPNINRLGRPSYPYWDVSAYCVVDNDYAAGEYPAQTPLGNLQVTAAHEFLHASQFSYDVTEDGWFMEGTAVWVEDEVYDDLDDNHQYLATSALTKPHKSLDLSSYNFDSGDFMLQYGAWLFFRFAEEWLGSDPAIVKEMWQRADGSALQEYGDKFSLKAVASAASPHGSKFKTLFADFGAANYSPSLYYEEGAAYDAEGGPPVERTVTLSAGNPKIGWRSTTVAHLSNHYVLFNRGSGVDSSARLRVTLDLPARKRGQQATLLVEKTSGAVKWRRAELDRAGDATLRVGFGGKVDSVVLVLSGASTRMSCWRGDVYSCQGTPRDHRLTHRYKAAVI